MRHINGSHAELALKPADLGTRAFTQLGIEIGQRLVEQKNLRAPDDGAGERDALLLPA
jgi:hypothetical protein